jgi:hypothetical protein
MYTGWGGGEVDNGALRRIFEPKWKDVRRGWGKLHNEEFPNSYSPKNVIWKNKLRRIKLAGYVTRMVY